MGKCITYLKKIWLPVISIICFSNSFSQNIVPNPSFEEYTECPFQVQDGWLECLPWQNGNCATTDYYHVCAISPEVSVPNNWVGYQEAHTGEAYMGFICKWDYQPWQEYPQVQLTQPCVAGYYYEVSFYVSLANYYCGIGNLGAYISILPPDGSSCGWINVDPQIESGSNYISDTVNWVLISGCFIAQGGEQWLTIGNFHSPEDSPTDPNCNNPGQSYYLLDDVSVTQGDPPESLELELGDPVTTCEPYEIDPGVTGVEYHWSNGSTDPTLLVTVTGTYALTITTGCSAIGIDSVYVFFEGYPQGVDLGPPQVTICEGDSYVISLDPEIGDYLWQDGSTDSEYTITTSGLYEVSFDDGCDITTDEILVVVNDIFFPDISGVPASLCEDDIPVTLSTVQDGISGNWSGPGVINNIFNPSGLNGEITLTFTPNPGQCAGAVTAEIDVEPLISLTISGITDSICQFDAPITLPDIQTGIHGLWSGQGVSNNIFDPEGLNGNIFLTFTPDAGFCAIPVTTSILVYENTFTITGIPESMCVSDLPVQLPSEQGEIIGNWSGPGVSNNTFNPLGLDGMVTLTFTPNVDQCASSAEQNIWVTELVTPVITGIPSSLCETDFPIDLPPIENDITGSWSGPGVTSYTFNPNSLSGNITLTFIPDAGQCAVSNTTDIEVTQVITPLIIGIPYSVCENNPPVTLPTMQNGIVGNWAGPGVSGNIFNPEDQYGNITLTFTPIAGQCAVSAQWDIAIESPIIPAISGLPSEICQSDLPINLPIVQNGYSGVWSGPGVNNNMFNPAELNGQILLFFNADDNQCADIAEFEIYVEPAILPTLSGIPNILCETDGPVTLPTIQDGITGNWTGLGVNENTFNPSGLNGNITLTFNAENGQCAIPATISISISTPIVPIITGVPLSICQSQSTILLPELQGGITGNWSGPNVMSNGFTPEGLNGNYILIFSPSPGQCGQTASAQITVHTPPSFINLIATCDSVAESYTVTFEITGGDPSSYIVNGNTVNGNIFTSLPFPSDSIQYAFTLDDAFGCGPVYVQGSINCACVTNAGNMDFQGTPLKVCAGSDFSVSFNGDANLDQNDLFGFVLHDNAGTQLGTIYAMSDDTIFTFPSGILLGQTYYVSPVAGSNSGSGSIDFNDPCLSVGQGIPVIFYQPAISISHGGEICQLECITYTLELTGEKPFELTYKVNANGMLTDHVLITDTNTVNLVICPQDYSLTNGTIDIIPLTLTDAECTVALSSFPGTQTTVVPSSEYSIAEILCPGQSILVNGIKYDQYHPSGTEVLQNAEGCDSTIHINLSFYPISTYELNQSLCFGESIVVNGTEYSESNPQGIEILKGKGIHGCDSIINIQLTFDTVITADFSTTLCSGESIVINGEIYNEFNSTGTELFPGESASGCDSILNIELFFTSQAISDLNLVLCPDEMIIINGNIYDISHPSGIEVLPDASHLGCDSSIQIILTFYPEAVGYITDTLGAGDSLIIQETIYHQHHSAGTEVIQGGSITGCDSIIEIALYFQPAMSARIETIAPVCYGADNGEVVVEEIIGGQLPYTISIDGRNPITVSGFPVVLSGLHSGKHELIISDATQTELIYELNVPEGPTLEVNAGADLIIPHGEDGKLDANASFQVMTWLWTPGDFLSCVDCPDPRIVKPGQNVTYTVVATDQNGCQTSDEVVITIVYENEMYIPTVFSPNRDDVNDTWKIYSRDPNTRLVTLQIFDRWGGILFNRSGQLLSDVNSGWDGKSKGKEVEPGVYVFLAEVEKNDGEIVRLKGSITLLR